MKTAAMSDLTAERSGSNGDLKSVNALHEISVSCKIGPTTVVNDDVITKRDDTRETNDFNTDCVADKLNPPNGQKIESISCCKRSYTLLYFVDNLFGGLFVGPLTVFCWRGLWNIISAYLFPNDKALSGYTCAVIGNVGLLVVVFIQTFLKTHLRGDNRLHWWLGYHVFTCVCFVLNVCHWHGMWFLLDYYTGMGVPSAWISFSIGQGFLLLFRCTKTAQAPPMVIVVDTDPDFFTYTTRFRTKAKVSENHILDVSFTVIVVHQLVVFYWRGVWLVMDVHLYPTSLVTSGQAALVIASVLFFIVVLLQPGFNVLYRRVQSPVIRWVLEVVIFFLAHIINVTVWRGVWILCDAYILPDTPDISNAVTILVGWFALTVMGCGHSLTVRGCELDGDATELNGCMCPNKFIRFHMDTRKSPKVDAEELRDVKV